MPALLSRQQLAAFLNVHPTTIDTLRNKGLVRGIKIGGRWRFATLQVVDLLRPYLEGPGL
jgi:hypothetical protein